MARLLIVDDEPNITEMIACALAPCGYQVDIANGGRPAIERLRRDRYDLVITDVVMKDADGFAVLEAARELDAAPPVIIITGFGSIQSAVKAMKQGAADYLSKPLDIAKLKDTVSNLLAAGLAPPQGPLSEAGFHGMVGRSEPMQQLFQLIRQIASTPATVMISGESGTGKELVARAIHAHSRRRSGPFVAVDCGSLPETLLESELFGHVKGAFTGATDDKTGLFEAAQNGTILLDEIGEMTPRVQHKLLRCIQERVVRPIGSTAPRQVDVRILSATNRDLPRLVEHGTFRQELYYRLNVVPVPVPSLTERRADIPLLADHFVRETARQTRRQPPEISETVLAMLSRADWPGNVRQLENVIECAVTFAEDGIIRP